MAIKYRVNYKDAFNNQWRLDIDLAGYSGAIIDNIRGASNPCVINHEGDIDNPFEAFFSSNAELSLHNQGNINVKELQGLQDREGTVSVYRNSALYWKGFIIPDGIEEDFNQTPSVVNISAIDGLELLEGIKFTTGNAAPPAGVDLARTPLSFISDVLYRTQNLGFALPIRWSNSIVTQATNKDLIIGTQWSVTGDGFVDDEGNAKNCEYVLRGMVEAIGGRIYQANGMWNIDRIADITTGSVAYKQRLTDTSAITTGTENINKTIGAGGYRFVFDDAISTIHPALKRLQVKYTHDQFRNILPNGSQDKVTLSQTPFDWGIIDKKSYQDIKSDTTLDARQGNSTRLINNIATNPAKAEEGLKFTTVSGSASASLPIDTSIIYDEMSVGFKFMIEKAAHDIVDGEMVVKDIPVTSSGLSMGSTFPIRFAVSMRISKAGGGTTVWSLNRFGNWIDIGNLAGDNLPYINQIEADFSTSEGVIKIGDVVSVSGSRGFMKMPEALTSMTPSSTCELRVDLFVLGNTTIRVDDIFVNVNGNNEVYESERTTTKFTDTEEYEMNISSSFNGFYVSNLMSEWSKSDEEFFFVDGLNIGSLTYIDSRAKLRLRGVPNAIIDTSFHGDSYSVRSIFNVEGFAGKKFMPLYSSFDTESGDTKVVIYEVHNQALADITTSLISSGNLSSGGGNWAGGGSSGGGGTPLETLQSVSDRGRSSTNILDIKGSTNRDILGVPDHVPLIADTEVNKRYLWVGDTGSGSPLPPTGTMYFKELLDVRKPLLSGGYLTWNGTEVVSVEMPIPADMATRSWVQANFATISHTHPNFTRTVSGFVPAPNGTTTNRYLNEAGGWVVPPNTTYAVMTAAELNTGTATTGRVMSAKVLTDWSARFVTIATKQVITGEKQFSTAIGLPKVEPINPDTGVNYIWIGDTGSGSPLPPVGVEYFVDLLDVKKPLVSGGYLSWDGSQVISGELPIPMDMATKSWVVAGFEPKFPKNTAFNKNFGTTADTVAEGNHTHDDRYIRDITSGSVVDSSFSGKGKLILGADLPNDIITSHGILFPHGNSADNYGTQLVFRRGEGRFRSKENGTIGSWRELWHSANLVRLSQLTNDLGNYGNWITQAQGDGWYSKLGHTHTFASLTAKPTTIAGYGITDAYTKSQIDTEFLKYVTLATKQKITGEKQFINALGVPKVAPASPETGINYFWVGDTGGGSPLPPVGVEYFVDLLDVLLPLGANQFLRWNGTKVETAELPIPAGMATQSWVVAGFEPKFAKNTAFNKSFGTAAGTVAEGNDSRILNGQTAFGWGNHEGMYVPFGYNTSFVAKSTGTGNDINDITDAVAYGNGGTNLPFNTNSTIFSARGLAGYGFQISSRSNRFGYRNLENGVWSDWQDVYHLGQIVRLRGDLGNYGNWITKAQGDSYYLQLTGGTVSGILNVTGDYARFKFQHSVWYMDSLNQERMYIGGAANENGILFKASHAGHQFQLRNIDNTILTRINMTNGVSSFTNTMSITTLSDVISLKLNSFGSTSHIQSSNEIRITTGDKTVANYSMIADSARNVIFGNRITSPAVRATQSLGIPQSAPPAAQIESGVRYLWINV